MDSQRVGVQRDREGPNLGVRGRAGAPWILPALHLIKGCLSPRLILAGPTPQTNAINQVALMATRAPLC